MNCAVKRHNCGNVKMKTLNYAKNAYHKEQDFDKIVDQLCTRLQDIKECDRPGAGMRMRYEHTEAVRKYCAAFPALSKREELPLQYCLPPPAWCRPPMPPAPAPPAPRRRRRRPPALPEWLTHEATWDMDTHDPVKDFIRAIAADEGYGTCDNTLTDDLRDAIGKHPEPGLELELELPADYSMEALSPRPLGPAETDMYAKFEAKFDRSLEALWAADTPDDECQDLPIDFHDLLSSPSDNMFLDPSAEKCSMLSLEKTPPPAPASLEPCSLETYGDSPEEGLRARLRPLRLAEPEPFSLYSYEGIYEALPSVAIVMRSLTALNHSKCSSFTEVLPRARPAQPPPALPATAPAPAPPPDADTRDDLLTSERTHFRPIRKEAETEAAPRHRDGDTFDIRGDLEPCVYTRSASGCLYLEQDGARTRYLEYRTRSIDYSRLGLTDAARLENEFEDEPPLRLKFPLRQVEVGVQTEGAGDARAAWACEQCGAGGHAKKMRQDMQPPSIWSTEWQCGACAPRPAPPEPPLAPQPPEPPALELAQEWEELLADISAAHAQYATEAGGGGGGGGAGGAAEGDRKRRRARWRPHASCSHPHAPFLHCLGAHRPLTR